MRRQRKIFLTVEGSGRADSVVSEESGIGRSAFSHPGSILTINGRPAKKSSKVAPGDEVSFEWTEEVFESVEKEDIPLSVIYEDDSILVINKESGMSVHPGAGIHSGTLVNALLYRYGEEFLEMGDERPGIVHRLDKDTSGTMVVAKNIESLRILQSQFSLHTAEKEYAAIVKGLFKVKEGSVDKNIARDRFNRKKFRVTDNGGRNALTDYVVVSERGNLSLVSVRIHTGRTHQIRVHMSSLSHPVLGDRIYSSDASGGLMLHSHILTLDHPVTGIRMSFTSPIPDRFESAFPGSKEAFGE